MKVCFVQTNKFEDISYASTYKNTDGSLTVLGNFWMGAKGTTSYLTMQNSEKKKPQVLTKDSGNLQKLA